MSEFKSAPIIKCSKIFCVIGFVASILIYFVVVGLSWGFAKGIPSQVHPTVLPLYGAICVLLPFALCIVGVILTLSSKPCKKMRTAVTICSCGGAFCLGGLCSFIGGSLMFAAAASPPPLSKYQPGPAAYMAFAIITGILAVVAGLIYCCAMVGCYGKERFDDIIRRNQHILEDPFHDSEHGKMFRGLREADVTNVMTLPHDSDMTLPHDSDMTLPHDSDMTLPHDSDMTLPHDSDMTLPHDSENELK